VLLYLLGLSYGAVSLALESLGVPLCKTEVYETVQAVAARVPGLKREQVLKASQDRGLGWGSDQCQMCRAMAASGVDRR
jgi:hypothetical protein